MFCVLFVRRAGDIVYTDKTPESARVLINKLIVPEGPNRLGYKSSENVKNEEYFRSKHCYICVLCCIQITCTYASSQHIMFIFCMTCIIDVDWDVLFDEMQRVSSAQLSQATVDLGHTIFADGEIHMEPCESPLFGDF
jgi:hypothetical protein